MCSLCVKFRCWPGPGSLLEQDSLYVWLLTIYLEAMAEREDREAKRQEREAKAKKG